MTAEQVLVFTRLAADKVGATKMDRPEDMERNPVTGTVFVALTNNTARTSGPDEANPRLNNKHGHILEIAENRDDAAALTFAWNLPLVCGDPTDPGTYFGGYDKTKVSPISCPDNVTFDGDGNLWISTDGNALGTHDGLFAVPVRGKDRGPRAPVPDHAQGRRGAAVRWVSEDQRSVFVAVQHPGEGTGASPATPISHFPDGGTSQPRPSVVVALAQAGAGRSAARPARGPGPPR